MVENVSIFYQTGIQSALHQTEKTVKKTELKRYSAVEVIHQSPSV